MDKLKDEEHYTADFTRLKHCLESVFKRVSSIGKRLGVLEKLIRKRVLAEANYARALNSVDEFDVAEEGSLANALEALSFDFSNQFNVRSELANSLNGDVLSPIMDFRANFLREMRIFQQKWRDARKRYQASNAKFTLIKSKYERLCEEYKASKETLIAAKSNPNINSENVVKISMKVNQSMLRYKKMTEKYVYEQTKWVQNGRDYDDICTQILKQIQLVDQQRIEILKDSLSKWVVFETSLNANRNYDVSGLATALDGVNANEDQIKFVSTLIDQHPLPRSLPLSLNDEILVFSPSQHWRETKILEIKKDSYLIHYIGFASKWDEWIPKTSSRIQPPDINLIRLGKTRSSTDFDFDENNLDAVIDKETVGSDDRASTPQNIVGSWIKGMLNRNNRAIIKTNSVNLQIVGAGSQDVNGVYLEGYTKPEQPKRWEMKKNGMQYFFHKSDAGFWKISCEEQRKDFYISILTANDAQLETLFNSQRVFTPVAGKDPPPIINFLDQNFETSQPQQISSDKGKLKSANGGFES